MAEEIKVENTINNVLYKAVQEYPITLEKIKIMAKKKKLHHENKG